jgi:hypothetical protein
MWKGSVLRVYNYPNQGNPMQSVNQVRAVPGRALEGDRYFRKQGTFSRKEAPDREVTFMAIESIEALKSEYGI